jgi:hypothetical protein
MKPSARVIAAALAVTLSACGGADAAAVSSAATASCTTQTLTTPILSTDCSTTAGYDTAVCLAGTPPVCTAGDGAGCACTGDGTNLWAAIAGVGLCGNNPELTRESWQSALCGAQTLIAKGDYAGACSKLQSLEADLYKKAVKATDKDIQHQDADALRQATQAAEAALDAAGTRCRNVTKAVI